MRALVRRNADEDWRLLERRVADGSATDADLARLVSTYMRLPRRPARAVGQALYGQAFRHGQETFLEPNNLEWPIMWARLQRAHAAARLPAVDLDAWQYMATEGGIHHFRMRAEHASQGRTLVAEIPASWATSVRPQIRSSAGVRELSRRGRAALDDGFRWSSDQLWEPNPRRRRNPDEDRRRAQREPGGVLAQVRAAMAAERLDGAAAAFEAELSDRVVSQGYGTLVSIAGSLWMLLFTDHTIGTAVARAFVYVYEGAPHQRLWRRATLTQPPAPDHVSELLTVLGPPEAIRAGAMSDSQWIPGDTVWVYQHTSERAHWLEENFRIYDGLISGVVPSGVAAPREVAMRWVTIFRAQGPLVRDNGRMNPGDESLRDLERRAAAGDRRARIQLYRERRRRGLPDPMWRESVSRTRRYRHGLRDTWEVWGTTQRGIPIREGTITLPHDTPEPDLVFAALEAQLSLVFDGADLYHAAPDRWELLDEGGDLVCQLQRVSPRRRRR